MLTLFNVTTRLNSQIYLLTYISKDGDPEMEELLADQEKLIKYQEQLEAQCFQLKKSCLKQPRQFKSKKSNAINMQATSLGNVGAYLQNSYLVYHYINSLLTCTNLDKVSSQKNKIRKHFGASFALYWISSQTVFIGHFSGHIRC